MTTELNAVEWFDHVNVNHRMRSWFVVCLKGRMHQMIWSSRIIQCDQNDYRIECHRMIWPCECKSSNAIMICRMTQRMHQMIWSSRIIQCDQNDYRIECHQMIWTCEPSKFESCDQLDFMYDSIDTMSWPCEPSNAIVILSYDKNSNDACHQIIWSCEPLPNDAVNFFLELDNVIKTHGESYKLNFRMRSHVFFWMNSHHLPCSKGVFQTKRSADVS